MSIQVLLYTDILVQTIARSQDYTVCKSHTPVQSGNAEGFSLYCKGTVLPVDSTCSGLRYAYLVFQRHGAPYSPSCRRNWYGPFQRPCSAYGSTTAPTDHVWLREPGSKQCLHCTGLSGLVFCNGTARSCLQLGLACASCTQGPDQGAPCRSHAGWVAYPARTRRLAAWQPGATRVLT